MTVTLPADDLQVHSITLPVMLPFYAGPLYAIHHLYAASTGPARYQCVASTTSIHLQQFENIGITVLLQMQVPWLMMCA